MKILQLTTHLNIGGIGTYAVNLAKILKDRGNTVFVASSGGYLENKLSEYGIPHFKLNISTKSELSPKVIKSFIALRKIVKDEKIELIHAHTRVAAVSAALVSFTTGIPYITTCHGFFKRRLGRLLCGCWGKKVVAISEAVKKHLTDDFGISEDKIALIYTGVDTSRFSKDLPEEEKAKVRRKFGAEKYPVIGTIGRLSPVKGQEVLLKAVNGILRGFPEAKILLIGDGPDEKRLRKLVSELGIGKNIIFAKSVDDTKEALSIMDVFVLPSIKEGLGLSLIEAMACGRPCVASRIGGIENIIEDGKNGLLFNPGDAEELAAAVKRTLTDRLLSDMLCKNGREKVLRCFTIDKMASEMEKLYREIVGKRRLRILIINVNWLGDVIFSTPFVRAIREAYPDSHITCMAVPRCKEILETNSRINELILFDEAGSEKGLIGKIRFMSRLKKDKFDMAFILHRSFTRALITFLAGIKKRIGYDTKGRGVLLTKKLKYPDREAHKVEYFLKLAEAVGADISKKNYEIFITDQDRKEADLILKSSGIGTSDGFVVLNPGGNWDPKRWPVESFSKLGDMLTKKYAVKVLISGQEKDKKLAEQISNGMNNEAISICGKTKIRELAAIFERAKLVVSGDSGPMHIAVGAGADTVAIFGPTNPDITGPYGGRNYAIIKKDTGCKIPCYDLTCRDNRCMKAVSADDVMEVIEKNGYLYENRL